MCWSSHVAVPALLISIYGFGATATSFVLPDYLTRVQGLRALQIGDALYWIALPQFVLVPLVVLLLKRIDARVLLVFGFSMIAIGSWIDTGLTHDWVSGDFMVSQLIEAVGLAFGITALITFGVANITPPQAAAIAATIQIARLLGNEIGSAVIQTFVRVREQVYSNLIGLHVVAGQPATEQTAGSWPARSAAARLELAMLPHKGPACSPALCAARLLCSRISTRFGSLPGFRCSRYCSFCCCGRHRPTR